MTTTHPNFEGSESRPIAAAEATETAEIEGDLLLVSNREPYQHRYGDDGEIAVDEPVGGLTAGLDPVMRRADGTWIAWGDGEADTEVVDGNDEVRVPPDEEAYTLRRIWLDDDDVADYYYGYSNQVLWPLCHSDVSKVTFEARFWERYREVNGTFADAAVARATEESIVWLNDYHFALAPGMIRPRLPDGATLVQFWHIPWPSWDVFQVCPQHRALLEGLLANDLLGFHLEEYCANFLECVDACFADAVIDWATGTVHHRGHSTTVAAFPMGVDAAEIERTSGERPETFWPAFAERHGIDPDATVAVGVDRLDYAKGILERLDALERFWERNPDRRGEVTYVQKASESRTEIDAYREYAAAVRDEIDRINRRFGGSGDDGWQPIVYVEERLSNEELYGLYRQADAALVSSLRDGMNLVAKEYVAAQVDSDGALLLSDLAGAHTDLGADALTVNPYDTEGFAALIDRALSMPAVERRDRMDRLRTQVAERNLNEWLDGLMSAAAELPVEGED